MRSHARTILKLLLDRFGEQLLPDAIIVLLEDFIALEYMANIAGRRRQRIDDDKQQQPKRMRSNNESDDEDLHVQQFDAEFIEDTSD